MEDRTSKQFPTDSQSAKPNHGIMDIYDPSAIETSIPRDAQGPTSTNQGQIQTRQRSNSTSSTISTAFSTYENITVETPSEELFSLLRNLINGGKSSQGRDGKLRYRAYLKVDLAAKANKLLDAIQFKYHTHPSHQSPDSNGSTRVQRHEIATQTNFLPEQTEETNMAQKNVSNSPPPQIPINNTGNQENTQRPPQAPTTQGPPHMQKNHEVSQPNLKQSCYTQMKDQRTGTSQAFSGKNGT
ncbi:hypothetical protein AVEN_130297-1 [Araneus ventricosus]|uniref:Uncharacterized protein n=1 Tax=Araneus ventricosus TaxID=182803 RepID=A0A4Y2V8A9_ARAVE|nr:hypothetical protein AVEN_106490-1 [Araneus ventricosus]GBO20316.1 hypothetical protein AVEN_130297-1 [Araneus ventricosus]